MIHEQSFICWLANQSEEDGLEIMATSIRSAAKRAVDSWRHDGHPNFTSDWEKVTVFVKDEGRRIHPIVVNGQGDDRAHEAFT